MVHLTPLLRTLLVPAGEDHGLGHDIGTRVLFQPCLQVHASAGIALGGYCSISLSASTAARENNRNDKK
jgi:hypothetical protein